MVCAKVFIYDLSIYWCSMLTMERGSRCPAHTQYTTITIIRKASTPPAIARAVTCNVVIANHMWVGQRSYELNRKIIYSRFGEIAL